MATAGATPHVEVRGIRELERGSRKLFANIDDGADSAFLGVADDVAASVRLRVPRRTGRLAASVETRQAPDGARASIGGYGVPYAGWIEFGGTRGRPYVPTGRYLFPVAKDAEPQAKRAGEELARDEIRRMIWPRPTTL